MPKKKRRPGKGGIKKILIVDDEPEIREELGELLRMEGHKTEVASNEREALKKFKKKEVDLVFLDIKMPGANGIEICEKIHKLNSSVSIIIVTGTFGKSRAEKALKKGAKKIIYKPFDVEKLLKLINKL